MKPKKEKDKRARRAPVPVPLETRFRSDRVFAMTIRPVLQAMCVGGLGPAIKRDSFASLAPIAFLSPPLPR